MKRRKSTVSGSTTTKDTTKIEPMISPFSSIWLTLYPRPISGSPGTATDSIFHSSIRDSWLTDFPHYPPYRQWTGGGQLETTLSSLAIGSLMSPNSLELTVKLQFSESNGSSPEQAIVRGLITSLNTISKTLKSSGTFTISYDPLFVTTRTLISSKSPGIHSLRINNARFVARIEYTPEVIESPRVVEVSDISAKSAAVGSKDEAKYQGYQYWPTNQPSGNAQLASQHSYGQSQQGAINSIGYYLMSK